MDYLLAALAISYAGYQSVPHVVKYAYQFRLWYSNFENNKEFHEPRDPVPLKKTYILSLTTSPKRIKFLPLILKCHLADCQEIHINIPLLFRNLEPYEDVLVEMIRKIPKVKVFRVEQDYGPITKVLPTFERLKGQDVMVVSIDDDVLYERDALKNIDEQYDAIGLDNFILSNNSNETYEYTIPYGCSMVCYPARYITDEMIASMHKFVKQKACILNDDMILAIAFYNRLQIRTIRCVNREFMSHNFDTDALWWLEHNPIKHKNCYAKFKEIQQ